MAISAKELIGVLRTKKTYDIRKDPKTGQKVDVSPFHCMACGREIYIVNEMENGDILGSECQGLLSIPVYRSGRTLTSKQATYARSIGMLNREQNMYRRENKTRRYGRQESSFRSYREMNPIESAPQYGLMQAVASGVARAKGISQHLAEEMIRKTPKGIRSKFARELATVRGKKKNPAGLEAEEEMSKSFHGRDPIEVVEVEEVEHYHSKGVILGDLCELWIEAGNDTEIEIRFKKDRPKLTCDSGGRNLEIVGGDQEIEVSNSKDKDKVKVGYISSIVYFTDKHHLEGPVGQKDGYEYEHEFGEEGGELPCLVYDVRNRKMEIVGGDYVIEAEGIRN